MYLMQQLEKLFNETTLFANVARPRRFALWTSILPNCVDTTLRGAVSSQNVGTESCTSPATDSKVRLEITACFGLIQKQQTTGSMQQPEPCRRRRQAPYTATSPLHESTGKSKNKWKRLVLKKFSSLAAVETVCFLENLYCACTIFHMILFPSVS